MANAFPPDGNAPQNDGDRGGTWLGHPKGLFLLFLVEMWERFSYYGMRAILVLYLISVISPHQLAPGTYSNDVVVTEVTQVEEAGKKKDVDGAVLTRSVPIVVGGSEGLSATQWTTKSGTPSLVLQRLKSEPDPDKPGENRWVPDPNGDATPAGLKGNAGDKNSFGKGEFAYGISNPTDKTISLKVEVARGTGGEERTFLRVNGSPDAVKVEVKPDAARTAEEQPQRIIISGNLHDSGRNWSEAQASTLYGWYTGLAYLFPILGGIIADKLIGTHRSMLVGGLLITIGHLILGVSGFGEMAQSRGGLSIFMTGLAVIVVGTGHFKPTVSVMVGQLYKAGDPRRDGAFTIFYMGINLGAFLCEFVVGTLGEKVGWHWGFGAAAVGMLLGLGMYILGKPKLLAGIGDAPRPNAAGVSLACMAAGLGISAIFGYLYHIGTVAKIGEGIAYLQKPENHTLAWTIIGVSIAGILGWCTYFVSQNRPEDRGPVITIFVFMIFNAFFWIAFEQAGSSINIFTEQKTDRMLGGFEVPATWFQSVNAAFIFIFAPVFAIMWAKLGRKNMNPSQPVKIALGLALLGLGYIFMVWAAQSASGAGAKASMMLIVATYFMHTMGELCLSPTGLSYVTKAAPVRFVSLLMGIWFVSSFIANLGGGLVAAQVKAIEKGEMKLPWSFGGQADFFFLFVVSSIGAALVIFLLVPVLKKMMRKPLD